MEKITNVVLSTTVGAADCALSQHTLKIKNCPDLDYRKIVSGNILPSLYGTPKVMTITPTAANSSEFTILIQQFVLALGRIVSTRLSYVTTASGDSATTICNAWRTQLAVEPGIEITGSGTATLILTANSNKGADIFSVTNLTTQTITIAATMGTKAVASNTTADPSVITTSAPHGYSIGQIVTLASDAEGKLVSGTYRIASVPLSTTLTLESLDGRTTLAGTSTTTGTLTLVAQRSRGQYADLVALGVTGATSGKSYSTTTVVYDEASGSAVLSTSRNQLNLYSQEDMTNYDAFKAAVIAKVTADSLAEEAVQVSA